MTGVIPWVAPVSWQGRGSGSTDRFERQFVTIKVEPWVSEETVRRTYREAQVRMLHGDNRPVKNKQLDLFRFVSSRTDPSTLYGRERARVAKELVPEWDRVHPTTPMAATLAASGETTTVRSANASADEPLELRSVTEIHAPRKLPSRPVL